MYKKYVKYIVAAVVGIGVAVCSWFFVVEPSYPYLLLDRNSPVVDDVVGIGYLPIEMTGGSADGAIVRHMCSVPVVYAKYVHNVVGKDSVMSADSDVGSFVLRWSWAIIASMVFILFGYLVYDRIRRNRK